MAMVGGWLWLWRLWAYLQWRSMAVAIDGGGDARLRRLLWRPMAVVVAVAIDGCGYLWRLMSVAMMIDG